MIGRTPSNEMQLDMLVWLLPFFSFGSGKKPSKLLNEGMIDRVSLNKETEDVWKARGLR